MKKQQEKLDKLKAGVKIAPVYGDSTSLEAVLKRTDPSSEEIFEILDSMNFPFDIEAGVPIEKLEEGSPIFKVGSFNVVPSEDEKYKWSVESRPGGFLRLLDAVLNAIHLEVVRLVTEKLKGE